MTDYKDPTNYKEIIEQIKNAPTLLQVTEILNSVFPTWIDGGFKHFSNDYDELNENWKNTCEKAGVEQTAILRVDNYLEDDNHKLIRTFAEIFTSCGFCVRRKAELQQCPICGAALLTEGIHKILNVKIPEVWSNKCSTC